MNSKLPPSDQEVHDQEPTALPPSDMGEGRHGLSQGAMRPERIPTLAPWSTLSWGIFVPIVFASNVVVATLAWIIVGLVMR